MDAKHRDWWEEAPPEHFTQEAAKHTQRMEASTGAKLLKQIQRDAQQDYQQAKERRGGKWA
jgi:hypothetical protein